MITLGVLLLVGLVGVGAGILGMWFRERALVGDEEPRDGGEELFEDRMLLISKLQVWQKLEDGGYGPRTRSAMLHAMGADTMEEFRGYLEGEEGRGDEEGRFYN